MTNEPIFIGGMERSGTSLMRAIIGSHPDIAIFEWDLPLWTFFFERFRYRDMTSPAIINELLDEIISHPKVRASHISLNRKSIEIRISEYPIQNINCALVFKCFLEEYAHCLGRPRWGLKTPYNEFFADSILSSYPNAKMVQLVRDPRDVAVSYQNCSWAKYSPKQHIEEWRWSVALSRKHKKCYNGRYSCVRYEDLVSHPESVVLDLCATLNLDFRPCMLEMKQHLGWKGNNSSFNDMNRAIKLQSDIHKTAIGRYRTHTQLDPDLIYLYQEQLYMDLIQLGYSMLF